MFESFIMGESHISMFTMQRYRFTIKVCQYSNHVENLFNLNLGPMNESLKFVEPQKCWKTVIHGLPPNQRQYKIF
jgi:hypothetical protein